jgi:hypothetical protein
LFNEKNEKIFIDTLKIKKSMIRYSWKEVRKTNKKKFEKKFGSDPEN